ncbi:hypothetical protein KPATCC21470_7457 [Kitasatospora purpeofusca]
MEADPTAEQGGASPGGHGGTAVAVHSCSRAPEPWRTVTAWLPTGPRGTTP